MFTGRFVVQWLSSERNKKVTIPTSFWVLSIAGSVLLLAYAIYRRDIVFVIGQSTGLFIYVRNLQMNRREVKEKIALSPIEATPAEAAVPVTASKTSKAA